MKKLLFVLLLFFIFSSCQEVDNKTKDLNQWLLAMIDRDLEPPINTHIQETLSDSFLLKQRLDKAFKWFKPREKGLQLFHNNKIGVGVLKKSNGINLVSLFDISRGVELLNNSNTSIFRINLSSGKDTIRLKNESSWNSVKIQWISENKNPILSLLFSDLWILI